MKHKLISNININFDSLGWALQTNPKEFDDPTFFSIPDRFFKLSEKYDFKYTIFVIGRDLENPAVSSIVKEWQDMGHEIGNHSYNHKPSFGSLSYEKTENEIVKSHNIIKSACKQDPRGFIAPGWATSKNMLKILINNNYLYDTSLFPSWFMYITQLKLSWNFKNDKRVIDNLKRTDYMANLIGSTEPFFSDGESLYKASNPGNILILPLPATKNTRIPCWHTMKFVLPSVHNYSLSQTLKSNYFYYLIHPMDLMDLKDIPEKYHKKAQVVERINIPLSKKIDALESAIIKIKNHSSKMATLSEIAENIYSERKI
jgi:peptidoglycan/xylan/chitin deacetylase (PgdA/CDA1 family)